MWQCGVCRALTKFTNTEVTANSPQVGSFWLLLYYHKINFNGYSPTSVALNSSWLLAWLRLHLHIQFTQLHATQLNSPLPIAKFAYFTTTFLRCKLTDILAIFPAYFYLWCLETKLHFFFLNTFYSQPLYCILQLLKYEKLFISFLNFFDSKSIGCFYGEERRTFSELLSSPAPKFLFIFCLDIHKDLVTFRGIWFHLLVYVFYLLTKACCFHCFLFCKTWNVSSTFPPPATPDFGHTLSTLSAQCLWGLLRDYTNTQLI